MPPSLASVLRLLAQIWSWLALVVFLSLDYKALEYLRYGPDIPVKPSSFVDYVAFGAFIALQVLLVFGLYRLHRRKSSASTLVR
jgi:hypothetical protein